jgi:hypothetical protein
VPQLMERLARPTFDPGSFRCEGVQEERRSGSLALVRAVRGRRLYLDDRLGASADRWRSPASSPEQIPAVRAPRLV